MAGNGKRTVVFSGGIGEHAAPVRSRICSGLGFRGIEMDETANAASLPLVSSATSRVAVHVIGTDDEVVMARAAYRVLHKRA
jgi:acetate kinase